MATARLKFKVRMNGLTAAERYFKEVSDRLDVAAAIGTQRSVGLLMDMSFSAMEDMAGGVYWRRIPMVTPTPRGARGGVRTGPNRPHEIRPRGQGPMRFQIEGRWVSLYVIDHPGSNPVDWTDGLGGFTRHAQMFYEQEVAKALERRVG